jgi:hypothetical protein
VLKELAPYKNLVVATGGGAVLRPKNWSYMHNGIVAWLQARATLLVAMARVLWQQQQLRTRIWLLAGAHFFVPQAHTRAHARTSLQGEPGLLARRVVAEGIEKRPLLFGEGVSGARTRAGGGAVRGGTGGAAPVSTRGLL